MSRHPGAGLRIARVLVALASAIVPTERRSAWRREWEAELWAAAHVGRPVVRPALGAFQHGFWLRRQAILEGVGHDARHSRAWLSGLSLDIKLGLRVLAKYPGLSLVAVLGMAVAIAIGAGAFGVIHTMVDPTLPLPQGDRLVSIQNWNAKANAPDRQSLHDFLLWREELASVRDVGAFRADSRTVVTDAGTELVQVAEITASGFRVAGTPPALGRPLLPEDEREGAAPVVVIGHQEWLRGFGGAPDILGRPVRLGSTLHTVVGVMPEGFRFPIHHGYWIPLRLDPSVHERGGGPTIFMFGRLADGVTLSQAQAELTTLGHQMAAAFPDTHEHLRPRVLPYAHPFVDIDTPGMAWALRLVQLLVSLLLALVAANVAVLVYARTVTRTGEIAVRSALGASRRRIVTQLFVEALVLSLFAAALGLTLVAVGFRIANEFLERLFVGQLPFWLELGLSPELVGYVVGLAVLAGAIVGVLPALKATGRRVQAGLQQLSSRGSQMQLGRTWTALIVVQVGIAVAVLPAAVDYASQSLLVGTENPGYPADEFVRGYISMEREEAPPPEEEEAYERAFAARFAERAEALLRRLEAEPGVRGVTFGTHYPGSAPSVHIEVEAAEPPSEPTSPSAAGAGGANFWVQLHRVDTGLFPVFDVPILAGRGFADGDAREGSTAVIVNRVLAERIGQSGALLGRRIRHVKGTANGGEVEEGPWLEIVGVVPEFPTPPFHSGPYAKLYQPLSLDRAASAWHWLALAIRVGDGSPPALVRRVREIAAAVDPALKVHELNSVTELRRQERQSMRYLALGIAAVTLSVLLLSAAGIYAMMSFTVARRRREIGIRSALGAEPGRVLRGIFARASAQLGAGVLMGLAVAAGLDWAMGGELWSGRAVILLPSVSALMMTIGLLAALGPARRGLAVQPTEALREE